MELPSWCWPVRSASKLFNGPADTRLQACADSTAIKARRANAMASRLVRGNPQLPIAMLGPTTNRAQVTQSSHHASMLPCVHDSGKTKHLMSRTLPALAKQPKQTNIVVPPAQPPDCRTALVFSPSRCFKQPICGSMVYVLQLSAAPAILQNN